MFEEDRKGQSQSFLTASACRPIAGASFIVVLSFFGLCHLHLQLPQKSYIITDVHSNYRVVNRMLNSITFKKEENIVVQRFLFNVIKGVAL